MTLRKAAFSSIRWSAASQFGRQVMQFATTIILARLLSPSDFGLLTMATVVTGFVAIFKDLGTTAAIIQQKILPDSLLDSLFWINVTFGLLATLILFAIAPLTADFYQEPQVKSILQVLSITFLVSGVSTLHQALLEKQLEFDSLAKIELLATLLGALVGVGSALSGAKVWSLVYQNLVIVTLTSVLLWFKTQWRPKGKFRWQAVKSLSSYSLNLTGFSILNYFIRNADYFLIGKVLGVQALGYYTLAYRLMLYPLQSMAAVIGRVLFPVFSRLQQDDARLRSAYLQVVAAIALITFPVMMGTWVLAETFIIGVFGEPWRATILPLVILSPVGLIQSIGTTVGTIYLCKGRTDWMFRWGGFAGILFMISFVIGLRWGIVGVATGYAIANLLLIYPNFAIPFSLIQLKMIDLVFVLWRPLLCSIIMSAVILTMKLVLPTGLATLSKLGVLMFIGIVTYLFATRWISKSQIQQLLSLTRTDR
jgi:O-antigen/teichoic acid export membrane protein